MAIIRTRLADRAALATWLQENAVPSFFGSVTYENNETQCYDDNGNLLLKISSVGGIYAYRAEGNSINFVPDHEGLGQYPIDLISCDNGIIMEGGYWTTDTGKIPMLIAKTNNGVTAIIFSYQYDSKTVAYYKTIKHVAFGDSETLATNTTFTPESGQQTTLVPFSTNAKIGSISYTPDAFYMPISQNYNSGIGKFIMGGSIWITNGYWAIRDGQSG